LSQSCASTCLRDSRSRDSCVGLREMRQSHLANQLKISLTLNELFSSMISAHIVLTSDSKGGRLVRDESWWKATRSKSKRAFSVALGWISVISRIESIRTPFICRRFRWTTCKSGYTSALTVRSRNLFHDGIKGERLLPTVIGPHYILSGSHVRFYHRERCTTVPTSNKIIHFCGVRKPFLAIKSYNCSRGVLR